MSALAQMKLLINLAQIDGSVAEREKNYIINIGRANGIDPERINPLFEQNHTVIVPHDLPAQTRFNYIVTLVQLMKIDERMYKEEIMYCSSVAEKLGYKRDVMFELMLHVKPDGMSDAELQKLKTITERHLK